MGGVMMQTNKSKITQIGSNLGVTIPLDILKEVNLYLGDSVIISVQNDASIMIRKKVTPKGVNPKFNEALNRTLDRYKETLQSLKNQ
jgi:antitoxin component of MazEF toxin-antitoxin module